MDAGFFESKTFSRTDLAAPAVARVAGELQRFALRLGVSGVPFAVNGVLRRRFRVRHLHKLWEYSRGLACLHTAAPAAKGESKRVLDFGGGATLPVYYLARCGGDVLSLDIDPSLTEATNRIGARRAWRLRGSAFDLTQSPPRSDWGAFDAVISFSVLEHLAKDSQARLLRRLATLVRPGGLMILTFDFGADAPLANAVRDVTEVESLVVATGLSYVNGQPFADTGERFALDKRYPARRFTFGSLFLRRPA